MKKSRGLRNNNPLNIRRNATKWQGLSDVQNDKSFFVFKSAAWGYRAAIITLCNYRRLHGLQTVRSWIERWAPPVENDTEAYIRCVCNRCGIAPGSVPDVSDKRAMCAIVSAMSFMENGLPAVVADVEKGWDLAVGM